MSAIPKAIENPDGLHQRYVLEKSNGESVDPRAVYFVLRLDEFGSDPEHIRACRQALWSYCNEIQRVPHLCGLCHDLRRLLRETAKDLSDFGEGLGQV